MKNRQQVVNVTFTNTFEHAYADVKNPTTVTNPRRSIYSVTYNAVTVDVVTVDVVTFDVVTFDVVVIKSVTSKETLGDHRSYDRNN